VWGRPDGLGDDGFEVTDTGHGRFVDDQKGAAVESPRQPEGSRSNVRDRVPGRTGDHPPAAVETTLSLEVIQTH